MLVGGSSQRRSRSPEVFLLDGAEQKVLPIFSDEGQAQEFLTLGYSGVWNSWVPRRCGAGELLSLLSGSPFSAGSCAGVEGVILDPSAEMAGTSAEGERLDEAACMSRRCFMERLMGRGRAWFEGRSQRETSEA